MSISADGRWALSGANDQTVNLWDLNAVHQSGESEIMPVFTLFPAADGEWIAWTPEGYFAASAQGAHHIGYSINQGVLKAAEFVLIDQLYDRFYRPDLLEASLKDDPQNLWQEKEASTDVEEVLAGGLAPRVAFINPTTDLSLDQGAVNVQANVMDQGGGIGKIVWKINDTTVATDSSIDNPASRLANAKEQPLRTDVVTVKQQLTLLPGDNTIALFAYNNRNEIASAPAVLTLTVNQTRPDAHPDGRVQAEPTNKSAQPAGPVSLPPHEQAVAPPVVSPLPETKVLVSKKRPSSGHETGLLDIPAPPSVTIKPAVSSAPSVSTTTSSRPTTTATLATPILPAPAVQDAVAVQPALHLLVVGINRYRDKALQLKYAVQDGRAIADIIQQTGAPLFSDVTVTLVFDDQVTIEGLDRVFRKVKGTIAPQDVFMFYLAGHGVTREGRYFFLPYDFRYYSDEAIFKDAVNQDHLQNWLSLIPARKSLVLIDTCESGSFTHSMVAMRGMAAKTAIAKLTRATGRATIVASTDDQPAL